MANGQINTPASLGDVDVTITPPDAGSLDVQFAETTTTFDIPAGCLWVKIENAGFVKDGDEEVDIQVNGEDWSPGRVERIDSWFDQVNNAYKYLPAFEIVANGSRVRITYSN